MLVRVPNRNYGKTYAIRKQKINSMYGTTLNLNKIVPVKDYVTVINQAFEKADKDAFINDVACLVNAVELMRRACGLVFTDEFMEKVLRIEDTLETKYNKKPMMYWSNQNEDNYPF